MKCKNKIIYITLITLFIVGIISFIKQDNRKENITASLVSVSDTESDDVLRLYVKGGYSPSTIIAKAGVDQTLRLITKSTFDCSSNIVINDLKINEYLPATGAFDIKIPPQEKGKIITGTCGMGMYAFDIKFE